MKYISVITPADTGAPVNANNGSCWLCCFRDKISGWCSIEGIKRDNEYECMPENGPMIHWLKVEPKLPRNILVL